MLNHELRKGIERKDALRLMRRCGSACSTVNMLQVKGSGFNVRKCMPEACDALESINETLAQIPSFRPSPIHLALHIMNFPQRAPHLHHATPDHARVDRHGLFDQFLHGGAGIESHDEVMSCIIAPLILLDRLGQEEAAPVGDASDHSALSEDDGAGSPGDSVKSIECQYWAHCLGGDKDEEGDFVLFDFCHIARPDLLKKRFVSC